MRRLFVLGLLFVSILSVYAQGLSLPDLEKKLLENNALLASQQLAIQEAEAQKKQAKVWSNPSLSISQINLWKTYDVDYMPPLIGNYGRSQQVAIDLEQEIQTAAKRKKRMAIADALILDQKYEYQDLQTRLKWQLGLSFYKCGFLYQQRSILDSLSSVYEKLLSAYKNNFEKQLITQTSLFRVQTEVNAIVKKSIELENELNTAFQTLKILTRDSSLNLTDINFQPIPNNLSEQLSNSSVSNSLHIKKQENEIQRAQKELDLELAKRSPDLTLSLSYDRGGNMMKDFVGLGLKFSLPIVDQNKGNIQAAKINVQRETIEKEQLELDLVYQLENLQNKLLAYERQIQILQSNKLENDWKLLNSYVKQLELKQISLLEFIDFTHAYLEAKIMESELYIDYFNAYQEIKYLMGYEN